MKSLAICCTILLATSAFAKSSNEYFFQPEGGKSALELKYQSGNAKIKTTSGGETKVTTSDFVIDYAYGLDANNALGAYTTFGNDESKTSGTTTKSDGMGDIFLYYKGIADIWHYGAELGINTAKNKSDNRSSGGMTVNLYGGAIWNNAEWNYGGKLKYEYPLERQDDSSPTVKTTGGDIVTLAAFGEYNYGHGFAGLEYAVNMKADEKDKTSGTSTTTKGDTYPNLKLYGSYEFSEMVEGLLSYNMYMYPKNSDNGTKAYTVNLLEAGVRLSF